RAILADAALYPRVVVSGDMNSRGIGKEFRAAGFLWPTEHNPRTHLVFNWDHVFLKGFAHTDGAGVVSDTLGASDHRPVWTLVSVTKLAELAVEAYVGARGNKADGGVRGLLQVPYFSAGVGADYNVRDNRLDMLVTLHTPVRRGGLLTRGTLLRLDWYPLAGH